MGTIKTYVRGVVTAALGRNPGMSLVNPGLSDELSGMASVLTRVTPDHARQILANAVAGDLASQHELFGMMLDTWPHLTKATSEVTASVRRISWQVQPYAEEGSKPTDAAEESAGLVRRALRSWRPRAGTHELALEDTIAHLLDARWRGVSVVELLWKSSPYGWLPRAGQHLSPVHYGWNNAGDELGLTGNVGGDRQTWRPFVPGKFLVGIHRARAGAPGSTALLRPLVPYWIGRTFGWAWLLRTAQLFGVPLRWATYDASRADIAAQVSDMLRNLGTAGWAAFPAGTELQLKEAAQNVRNNPQAMLMELADQAADLLILGQTLSSSSSESTGLGSGTAQLHGQVRREVLADAAWWVADHLSYQLAPAVLELNQGAYDDLTLPVVRPDLSIPADPKAEAERLEILSRMGMRIPVRWAHETTGVPEPTEDEDVIEPRATTQMNPQLPGVGPADPEIDPETPSIERKPKEALQDPEGHDDPSKTGSSTPAAFAGVRGRSVFGCPIKAQAFSTQGPVLERFFEDMTGTTARWLSPVEEPLNRLLELAQDGAATESDFQKALADARGTLPELFDQVDTEAMATALRRAMASELVNGAVSGSRGRRAKA
jgi:phage gp29-like protein